MMVVDDTATTITNSLLVAYGCRLALGHSIIAITYSGKRRAPRTFDLRVDLAYFIAATTEKEHVVGVREMNCITASGLPFAKHTTLVDRRSNFGLIGYGINGQRMRCTASLSPITFVCFSKN